MVRLRFHIERLACDHCGGSGRCPICKGRPLDGGCPCLNYRTLIRNPLAPVAFFVNSLVPGNCPSCRGNGHHTRLSMQRSGGPPATGSPSMIDRNIGNKGAERTSKRTESTTHFHQAGTRIGPNRQSDPYIPQLDHAHPLRHPLDKVIERFGPLGKYD